MGLQLKYISRKDSKGILVKKGFKRALLYRSIYQYQMTLIGAEIVNHFLLLLRFQQY